MSHLANVATWVVLGSALVCGCGKSKQPEPAASLSPVSVTATPDVAVSPSPGNPGNPGNPGGAPGSPGGGVGSPGVTPGTPIPSASPPPLPTPRKEEPPIRPGLVRMPGYQASLTKPSQPMGNSDSVARGYGYYGRYCIMCHGSDLKGPPFSHGGRPTILRDLAEPDGYKYGATDQALYRTILYGVPRTPMGNYESVMKENQVWDVITFLKSRWRVKRT